MSIRPATLLNHPFTLPPFVCVFASISFCAVRTIASSLSGVGSLMSSARLLLSSPRFLIRSSIAFFHVPSSSFVMHLSSSDSANAMDEEGLKSRPDHMRVRRRHWKGSVRVFPYKADLDSDPSRYKRIVWSVDSLNSLPPSLSSLTSHFTCSSRLFLSGYLSACPRSPQDAGFSIRVWSLTPTAPRVVHS